jgi:signal transduction histidine kinase/CheY-like chemotaxis protein
MIAHGQFWLATVTSGLPIILMTVAAMSIHSVTTLSTLSNLGVGLGVVIAIYFTMMTDRDAFMVVAVAPSAALILGHPSTAYFWLIATLALGIGFPRFAPHSRSVGSPIDVQFEVSFCILTTLIFALCHIATTRMREVAVKDAASLSHHQARLAFLARSGDEMREPLHVLLAAGRALRRDRPRHDGESHREHVSLLEHSSLMLLSHAYNVLDVTRDEVPRLVTVDLCPMTTVEPVLTVHAAVHARTRRKGIEFHVDVSSGSVPHNIVSDGARIRQVLMNLVDNAIKFTDLGGVHVRVTRVEKLPSASIVRVFDAKSGIQCDEHRSPKGRATHSELMHRLNSASSGPYIMYEVQDTGLGIQPGAVESCFEVFAQATMTRFHEGSGLGLALSRAVALSLGGAIGYAQVIDKVASGSRFWLAVPLVLATTGAVETGRNRKRSVSQHVKWSSSSEVVAPAHGDTGYTDVLSSSTRSTVSFRPAGSSSSSEDWSAASQPATTDASLDFVRAPSTSSSTDTRSVSILVVEDNPLAMTVSVRYLQRAGFHDIQSAYDGTEALMYANQRSWDIVLMDLYLPGMSGIEIARKMRDQPSPPRILLVTAREVSSADLAWSGAELVLRKPYSSTQLHNAIKQVLEV